MLISDSAYSIILTATITVTYRKKDNKTIYRVYETIPDLLQDTALIPATSYMKTSIIFISAINACIFTMVTNTNIARAHNVSSD